MVISPTGHFAYGTFRGITESSTDPLAVPPANLVGNAFSKRRPVGWCGGGSVTAGTTE